MINDHFTKLIILDHEPFSLLPSASIAWIFFFQRLFISLDNFVPRCFVFISVRLLWENVFPWSLCHCHCWLGKLWFLCGNFLRCKINQLWKKVLVESLWFHNRIIPSSNRDILLSFFYLYLLHFILLFLCFNCDFKCCIE